MEGLMKHRLLGSTLRVSDSVGLGWSPRICRNEWYWHRWSKGYILGTTAIICCTADSSLTLPPLPAHLKPCFQGHIVVKQQFQRLLCLCSALPGLSAVLGIPFSYPLLSVAWMLNHPEFFLNILLSKSSSVSPYAYRNQKYKILPLVCLSECPLSHLFPQMTSLMNLD